MTDSYSYQADTVSSPARRMFLIVPHASDPLPVLPKAIRANAAGTVTLRAVDAATDVTVTLAAGEILPVRAQYVRVSGTTVAVLHGLA